jgi:hypothetical protein
VGVGLSAADGFALGECVGVGTSGPGVSANVGADEDEPPPHPLTADRHSSVNSNSRQRFEEASFANVRGGAGSSSEALT